MLGVKAFNCGLLHTVTLSCFKAGFIALSSLRLNIESILWKSPSSLVFLEKDYSVYHLKVKENPFRGFWYASWHNVDTARGNASVTDDLGEKLWNNLYAERHLVRCCGSPSLQRPQCLHSWSTLISKVHQGVKVKTWDINHCMLNTARLWKVKFSDK